MSETLGQFLAQARAARGETLDDVEQAIHIRARQLAALEADDYAALPSLAQTRGYVKNYAQHLGLDLQDVLGRYEAALTRRPAVRRPEARPKPGVAARPVQPAAARPVGPAPRAPAMRAEVAGPASGVPQVRRRPRLISADLLVAAVITMLLVALLVWGGSRLATSLAATVTPTVSATSGLTTPGPTASPTPPPQPSATVDLPTPAASYSGVDVVVRAEQRSWVSVKVDGAEIFAGLMPPGEAREFSGKGVVEVVTGNGKGTRVLWDGVDQGVMGELGEVVDRLWTLQGMLIPTPTITPTPSATPRVSATSAASATASVSATP